MPERAADPRAELADLFELALGRWLGCDIDENRSGSTPAMLADLILDRYTLSPIDAVDSLRAAWATMRPHVVQVLIYHQPTNTSGCICGWGVLGHSHSEHVADVIEEMIAMELDDA